MSEKYKITANGHSVGDNDDTISDFYDSLCSSKSSDPISECPHICESLYYVRHSGDIIYAFGSIVIVISFIAYILSAIKYKKPGVKLPKTILYLINGVSLLLYVIGFIAYYISSKFSENFDSIDTHRRQNWNTDGKVYEFYWSFGMIFSIFIFGAQILKVITIAIILKYV